MSPGWQRLRSLDNHQPSCLLSSCSDLNRDCRQLLAAAHAAQVQAQKQCRAAHGHQDIGRCSIARQGSGLCSALCCKLKKHLFLIEQQEQVLVGQVQLQASGGMPAMDSSRTYQGTPALVTRNQRQQDTHLGSANHAQRTAELGIRCFQLLHAHHCQSHPVPARRWHTSTNRW